MITKLSLSALICLCCLPLACLAADGMRCEGGLVDRGALKLEVLAACGEPAHRERWFQGQQAPFSPVEVWTYNFGPNQFLRRLHFREGRLRQIETDGYGFRPSSAGRCEPREIQPGLSGYRLRRLCGSPDSIDVIEVLAPLRQSHWNSSHRPVPLQPVHRELWVYNFGSRHFLREVTLENGRVVMVDNGRRGFD